MNLNQFIQDFCQNAKKAFLRFPFVLLTAITAFALSVYLIETDGHDDRFKLVFSVLLGIPFYLSAQFFIEGRGLKEAKYKWVAGLAGIILISVQAYFTFQNQYKTYVYSYAQLTLCLHLLASFVAFLGDKSDQGFWELNKSIFIRICLSVLYSGVLYSGLSLGLFATSKMFALDVDSDIYLEIWCFCALVFQTWHFLGGLPENIQDLHKVDNYPKGLRVFVTYLLIPLVSLYMLILYVYAGKILVSWELPKGYVGWLVSVISILGLLNLLLLYPERQKEQGGWIQKYSKMFYLLILPLLVLLFVSIGVRIQEYGFTEKRYILLCLGLLLFGLSLYFLISRQKSIKVIPISLMVVIAFTSFGPWGVFQVSMNSQLKEIEKILEQHGLLKDGKLIPTKEPIDKLTEHSLSSKLDYILRYHGQKALEPWFSNAALEATRYWGAENKNLRSPEYAKSEPLLEEIGVRYRSYYNAELKETSHITINTRSTDLIDIRGYSFVFPLDYTTEVKVGKDSYFLETTSKKLQFVIKKNQTHAYTLDLAPLFYKIYRKGKENFQVKLDEMRIQGQGLPKNFVLQLTHLNATLEAEKVSYGSISGYILIK